MEGRPLACLSLASVSLQPCSLPYSCPTLKEPLHLVRNPRPVACPSVQGVVQLPAPWDEGSECEDGFFQVGGDCIPVFLPPQWPELPCEHPLGSLLVSLGAFHFASNLHALS